MEKKKKLVVSSAHGFDWCSKQREKAKRANRTPGKTKVLSCQATTFDRFFNKRSRAYKRRDYKVYYKQGSSKTYIGE